MFFQKVFIFFFCYSLSAQASFIELELEYYLSPPITSDQLKDYAFLKGGYDFDFKKRDIYFNSELLFEHSLGLRKWLYFEVPQVFLSYQYHFTKPFYSIELIEVSVGRKKQVWSEGDKYWGLGLWNPLILWNPLFPEEKGTVGSFVSFHSKNWKSDVFIGAIHFPDSVAHFREKNQETYTYSRWGSILPSRIHNHNLPIYYTLKNSYLFDYINQRSFFTSFSTWTQQNDSRYWIKWSLAYKPTNHIYYLLNQDKRLKVSAEKDRKGFYIDQTLTGVYSKQRILSTEWGLDYQQLSMIFSLENATIRDENILEESWSFFRSRESFTYLSFLLKYYYWDQSVIELGLIQSWFGNYTNHSKLNHAPAFLSQHRMSNGFSVAVEHKGLNRKELPFILKLKYQYSFLDQSAWLSFKALYYLSSKFYTKASVQVLGGNSLNENAKSFLHEFYYNDYVTWGLVYDF